MDDLIRRADAMGAVQDHFNADGFKGYDDWQKMMDRINALPSAEAVQGEWIPCSERLPEPPTFCLVTTDGSYNDVIDIALYMSDGWHKASKVLAWMPLPTPYKGSDDE